MALPLRIRDWFAIRKRYQTFEHENNKGRENVVPRKQRIRKWFGIPKHYVNFEHENIQGRENVVPRKQRLCNWFRIRSCLKSDKNIEHRQKEDVFPAKDGMCNYFRICNWCGNDENEEHKLTHNMMPWRHRIRNWFAIRKRSETFEQENNQRRENAVPWKRRLCNWFGIRSCLKSDKNEEHRQKEDVSPDKDGMTDCIGVYGCDKYQRMDDEDCDQTEIVMVKHHSQDELIKQLDKNKKELTMLRNECSELRKRNDDLSRQLNESHQQVDKLKKDCNQLRTRLSETASMQLTEGNPNIADLSDQNRPDKLAEHFSELYDNEWTDCYEVLLDDLQITEEESIQILLHIVQTSYHICLEGSQNVTTTAKNNLFAFAGRSDTEPDKALDALIQAILHNLRCFRTKNFKAAPANIGKEVKARLLSTICEPVVDACSSFTEICIKICWLMCIKDPPMYIFCDKEAVFDQNKYTPYTKTGPEVSYVVWPALYLHQNGPLMRKGIAQGQKGKSKVNSSNSLLLELNHLQDYHTGIQAATTRESDEQPELTALSEELPSKDNVGSTTNLSHVTGFESNRDDSGKKQTAEASIQQTTPKGIHSMIEQPTLECSVIETTGQNDYKKRLDNDTAMSDLE